VSADPSALRIGVVGEEDDGEVANFIEEVE